MDHFWLAFLFHLPAIFLIHFHSQRSYKLGYIFYPHCGIHNSSSDIDFSYIYILSCQQLRLSEGGKAVHGFCISGIHTHHCILSLI